MTTDNDLLNAHDVKEEMERAVEIQNTKIAVTEIIPGAGYTVSNKIHFLF